MGICLEVHKRAQVHVTRALKNKEKEIWLLHYPLGHSNSVSLKNFYISKFFLL